MKHPIRCLPLVLAAIAVQADAQSLSSAWDEYRNKEQSSQATAPSQPASPQARATTQAAATPQAAATAQPQAYPAPAAPRAAAGDHAGFFIGAQGGRGWIYDDIEQRAFAISAGYRWQTGPWAQVGVEISGGRLDSTREDGYLVPEARYGAVGANARFNFGHSRWFAVVRGGYFSADQDNPFGDGDFSTDGGYAGLGIGVDINRHFNVSLGYTAFVYADDYYYDDCRDYDDCRFNRADTVMLGIEARF